VKGGDKIGVLAVILGSYLMIVLDISVVITGLPIIRQSLGFSASTLSWVHSAYTLSFAALLLVLALILALALVVRATPSLKQGH